MRVNTAFLKSGITNIKGEKYYIGKSAYDLYPKKIAESIIKHSNEVILSRNTLFQE